MAVLGIMLSCGCADRVQSVLAPEESVTPTAALVKERPVDAAFSIETSINGNPKLGQPFIISARIAANFATNDTELSISLPEVAAAERTGWDRAFHMTIRQRLPVAASWSGNVQDGQIHVLNAPIIIRTPGYYRIVVSTRAARDQQRHANLIQTSVEDVRWLWIDSVGARISTGFDSSLFPKGAIVKAGPLAYHVPVRTPSNASLMTSLPRTTMQARDGLTHISQRNSLRGEDCWIDGDIMCSATFYVSYYDTDSTYTRPVAGAHVTVTYRDQDPYNGGSSIIAVSDAVTRDDGSYDIDCHLHTYYTNSVIATAAITASNDKVEVRETSSNAVGQTVDLGTVYDACGNYAHGYGWLYDLSVTDAKAFHVMLNMDEIIDKSRLFFGYSRNFVEIHLHPSTSGTADYGGTFGSTFYKDIELWKDDIWGFTAQTVQAHEYGHALYDDALGGIDNPTFGCGGHTFDGAEDIKCAWIEGFATYHAAALGLDYWQLEVNDIDRTYPCTSYYSTGQCAVHQPSRDGSIVEGAVSMYLYDLTDPANETHDQVQYSGYYLASVIKNCRLYGSRGAATKINGVDDLTYCMADEVGSSYQGSYFPTRSDSYYSVASNVTHPTGWSKSANNAVWLWNLYRQ